MGRRPTADSQPLAIVVCVCGEGTLRVRKEEGVEIVIPCAACGSVDIQAARQKKTPPTP